MDNKKISVNYEDKNIVNKLSNYLYSLIKNTNKLYKDIIFICIGTDRCTGDSYAPLIGYNLHKKYSVQGTIHNPVHAQNLDQILNKIDIDNNLIIALDASLGNFESIGNINIINGSIKPGTGVGKDLTSVGDISITGIVNFSGFQDFLVLQNTRLSTVVKLSEITCKVINKTMKKILKENLNKIA